jgi:two-component system, NarL family, response regulator DevR
MQSAATIRVLLLDSHDWVRTALRNLLKERGHAVVGSSSNLAEGQALAARLAPDIVLMEAQFPSGCAIEACRAIRKAAPATRVVFLTSATSAALRLQGILAGADGYLRKDARLEDLSHIVAAVARGTSAIDADTVQILRDSATANAAVPAAADIGELTPQERRILPLIAEGMTNKQIGDVLGLSHKTVKNHLSSVFQKLQVSRRAQLAAIVAATRRP